MYLYAGSYTPEDHAAKWQKCLPLLQLAKLASNCNSGPELQLFDLGQGPSSVSPLKDTLGWPRMLPKDPPALRVSEQTFPGTNAF
jgi:hypothetical protein